ncbi:MAG TPA: transposase [Herpetosiphonaceae bacterium]
MPGRTFTREFKLAVVRPLARGLKRPAQVCREYGLAESVLSRWRKAYDARGEAAFLPKEPTQREALDRKIAELERFCGQLAVENAIFKKSVAARPYADRHAMLRYARHIGPQVALRSAGDQPARGGSRIRCCTSR